MINVEKICLGVFLIGFIITAIKLHREFNLSIMKLRDMSIGTHQELRALITLCHKTHDLFAFEQPKKRDKALSLDTSDHASLTKVINEKKQFNRHPYTNFKNKFNKSKNN